MLAAEGPFYSVPWLASWTWTAAAGRTKGAGRNENLDLCGLLAQTSHGCFISSAIRWGVEKEGSWEASGETC